MDNNQKTIDINVGMENIDSEASKVSLTEKSDGVSHSLVFRAMILFQVLAYGSYSVLVHLCERNGAIMFSSTTMNLVLELIKLVFSLTLHFFHSHEICPTNFSNGSWLRHSLPYSIPGVLYFINNNLAVHMQLQMDPASYQVLSNFKIVTTAILYRIIMKQKLSRQQWFAVSLLFFGGFFYSLGRIFSGETIRSNRLLNPSSFDFAKIKYFVLPRRLLIPNNRR
jgi:probable UDP-sugar transporter A4